MADWDHYKLSYPKNKKQTKIEKEKDMIVYQWKSTETAVAAETNQCLKQYIPSG